MCDNKLVLLLKKFNWFWKKIVALDSGILLTRTI